MRPPQAGYSDGIGESRKLGSLRAPTHTEEGLGMAGLGKLTVRFQSGEVWSVPFTGQMAKELSDRLGDSADPHEWVTLEGPDRQERDQIMVARQGAMESILWVEEPGMMEAAAEGDLGDETAAEDS
jgi:hypothetical protein